MRTGTTSFGPMYPMIPHIYLASRETGDWGLGIGDWGLGIRDWDFADGPTRSPSPQSLSSPIPLNPNPQSLIPNPALLAPLGDPVLERALLARADGERAGG